MPFLGISLTIKKPRRARSTMVAVTSLLLTRSSMRVPTSPGERSLGGA